MFKRKTNEMLLSSIIQTCADFSFLCPKWFKQNKIISSHAWHLSFVGLIFYYKYQVFRRVSTNRFSFSFIFFSSSSFKNLLKSPFCRQTYTHTHTHIIPARPVLTVIFSPEAALHLSPSAHTRHPQHTVSHHCCPRQLEYATTAHHSSWPVPFTAPVKLYVVCLCPDCVHPTSARHLCKWINFRRQWRRFQSTASCFVRWTSWTCAHSTTRSGPRLHELVSGAIAQTTRSERSSGGQTLGQAAWLRQPRHSE